MDVTVVVHKEQGALWAEVPELPGCLASGRTLEELREGVAEAVGLYLWDLPGELHGDVVGVGRHPVTVTPAPAQPPA